MKLTFIGTGSAFAVGMSNYNSNMILENDQQRRLLIDCGSDARHALHELNLSYKDIESVYISHLHADHVGGLEWLGFATMFDPSCTKPHLYISEKLVDSLWNNVLSGGMSSIDEKSPSLASYFDVNIIQSENNFKWSNVKIEMIPTLHVESRGEVCPSFGLFFTINKISVFITTDTQFKPDLFMPYYLKADMIFHDCETSKNKSGVHSHFEDLKTLDMNIKKKIWLYHYSPGTLPDAKKHGFRGFVKKGQSFDFSKLSNFL